jgi:adenylate cyclase
MARHRQLAAILFTDIEGYTTVLLQDEQKAMDIKDRHRDVIEKEHQKFNGRVIQYYGDGTLSTFASVVDAVKCALSMQQQYLQQPTVSVRMGLHIGDILFDEESIFGEGVNLASRIESLGVAGSVLLSDKANDELHNHPEIKTIPVGVYHLKNIDRAVEVFALNHEGLVKPVHGSLKGKTQEENKSREPLPVKPGADSIALKSIAVLPFVNMSNDPDQEYFSDGMAEEIINSLSHLRELKVAGRTSSFQFKTKNADLREIGDKLGVSTVLEGSVRRQGNKLRVTAQLIKVADGFHIWSERYDRDMGDVFAIQDEISFAITERLKISLLEEDRIKITTTYTHNTEAYELYLKGRFYINRRGVSIADGIKCFEGAIVLDPDFSLAYAGYADALLLAASYGLAAPRPVMEKVKRSAFKAIQLTPHLSEPYSSLGFYYAVSERNWAAAKKHFLKSIELNPRHPQAHYWYGYDYLSWVEGDFSGAEKHGKIAVKLEPLSAICHAMYASILHTSGKFEEGLAVCKAGIELDPNSFLGYLCEGNCYDGLQEYVKAISSYENAMRISNGNCFSSSGLIRTYCNMGRFEEAGKLFAEVKKRSESQYMPNTLMGLSSAYLGDLDEAFRYFQKAFDEPESILLSLKYEPWVPSSLKADPRYQVLLKNIGFPESAV